MIDARKYIASRLAPNLRLKSMVKRVWSKHQRKKNKKTVKYQNIDRWMQHCHFVQHEQTLLIYGQFPVGLLYSKFKLLWHEVKFTKMSVEVSIFTAYFTKFIKLPKLSITEYCTSSPNDWFSWFKVAKNFLALSILRFSFSLRSLSSIEPLVSATK